MEKDRALRIKIFCAVALALCAVLAFLPLIPQDLAYHNFADQRRLFGVPNFWNVVSNLPFILIAVWAGTRTVVAKELYPFVFVFYTGFLLTGFGSAWYHWSPSNASLVWDRLPMTIAFMAFFALMLALHFNIKTGLRFLTPLLLVGIFSVFYWAYTERVGQGDLRLYAGVQFIPILLIPLLIVLLPTQTYSLRYLVWLILAYIGAKIFEHFDSQIYAVLPMSGHAIKHVLASLSGIAFYFLVNDCARAKA